VPNAAASWHTGKLYAQRRAHHQWINDMHREQPEGFETFAKRVTPLQGRQFADFTEWERDTYRKAHHNLHGSPEAVISLARAVEHVVRHDIPGTLVERGVYMGGNIEVMIGTLNRHYVNAREIYLYDTFYSSARHELTYLYPKLSSKGILIIDDYGAMPGAKKPRMNICWQAASPSFSIGLTRTSGCLSSPSR
jgi:macrocin-O-methyltransferase TylF-like protien